MTSDAPLQSRIMTYVREFLDRDPRVQALVAESPASTQDEPMIVCDGEPEPVNTAATMIMCGGEPDTTNTTSMTMCGGEPEPTAAPTLSYLSCNKRMLDLCKTGSLSEIQEFTAKYASLINIKYQGWAAWIISADRADHEVCLFLTETYALNKNTPNVVALAVFELCISRLNLPVCKLLVKPIGPVDVDLIGTLQTCCLRGDIHRASICWDLLPTAVLSNKITEVIQPICFTGHLPLITALVGMISHSRINILNALSASFASGSLEAVDLLLEHVKTYIQVNKGRYVFSILIEAAAAGDPTVFQKVLLAFTDTLKLKARYKQSQQTYGILNSSRTDISWNRGAWSKLFQTCCSNKNPQLVLDLLTEIESYVAIDDNYYESLELALQNGHDTVTDCLMKKHTFSNISRIVKGACLNPNSAIVDKMLECTKPPITASTEYVECIEAACSRGHTNAIRFIIMGSYKAGSCQFSIDYRRRIFKASCSNTNPLVFDTVIESLSTNPTQIDKSYEDCLKLACNNDLVKAVQFFLDGFTFDTRALLHSACIEGRVPIAELLLSNSEIDMCSFSQADLNSITEPQIKRMIAARYASIAQKLAC